VSSAPVLRETVQTCDIGVACAGDAPADLADGIEEMHRRLDAGHEHAFGAYRQQFSWEENTERTLTVYRELLS
jgi:glycosyltransferase involved in cell wall biosynthesis